jgi:hypothetical protein
MAFAGVAYNMENNRFYSFVSVFFAIFALQNIRLSVMMKQILSMMAGSLAAVVCLAGKPVPSYSAHKKSAPKVEVSDVRLSGYVGQRIDDCIRLRIMGQNAEELIAPFRQQTETRGLWASEFWGKWIQGAMSAWQYNHDPALLSKIEAAETGLMDCQLPKGFIGDYTAETETTGWDIWGRKYTLLGLIKWYRLSGEKRALKAACRLLDYTLTQVGSGKKSIYECGYYRGMPPASILEPVMFLYNETKDERYLDFAKYISRSGEQDGGPLLVAKADVPVASRWPLKPGQNWWSWHNGQKAYEMMSCYVGLLELYRVTGENALLEAARKTWQHIVDEELNITGGSCTSECWYGGKQKQTQAAQHTMETCVSFTWMQFCERLMDFDDSSRYADQIELTMYNALMASMKYDGSQIVKYVPLTGFRREGENQCDVRINCCNANGVRAFSMIPRLLYHIRGENRVEANLYIPSEATIQLAGQQLVLRQETDYPVTGEVRIKVLQAKTERSLVPATTIALRIPYWSEQTTVELNGEKVEGIQPGTYLPLQRQWKQGDEICLHLDMAARLHRLNGMIAVKRGPVVLARDTRFDDGFIDDVLHVLSENGVVELTPVAKPEHVWMAFTMPALIGPYSDRERDQKSIHLCDFASAGNTWNESHRYRTWFPHID